MTSRLNEAELINLIRDFAAETCGERWDGRKIDRTADLSDLGLDSIDVVLLTSELGDRFGIDIDPAFFLKHTNVGLIIDELRRMKLAD